MVVCQKVNTGVLVWPNNVKLLVKFQLGARKRVQQATCWASGRAFVWSPVLRLGSGQAGDRSPVLRAGGQGRLETGGS